MFQNEQSSNPGLIRTSVLTLAITAMHTTIPWCIAFLPCEYGSIHNSRVILTALGLSTGLAACLCWWLAQVHRRLNPFCQLNEFHQSFGLVMSLPSCIQPSWRPWFTDFKSISTVLDVVCCSHSWKVQPTVITFFDSASIDSRAMGGHCSRLLAHTPLLLANGSPGALSVLTELVWGALTGWECGASVQIGTLSTCGAHDPAPPGTAPLSWTASFRSIASFGASLIQYRFITWFHYWRIE